MEWVWNAWLSYKKVEKETKKETKKTYSWVTIINSGRVLLLVMKCKIIEIRELDIDFQI